MEPGWEQASIQNAGGVSRMKAWPRELRDRGRTIWLASHALDTIERVCDHVALRIGL